MDGARRRILEALAAYLAAGSVSTFAQAAAGTRPMRVAIFAGGQESPEERVELRKWLTALFAGHGLQDGEDIEITINPTDPLDPKFEEALRKAVDPRPEVILAHTNGFIVKRRFLPIVRGIPLVVWGVDDGGEESIEGLNRQGENVTGALYSYLQLVEIRIGLMKQLKPGARRFAIVIGESPASPLKNELIAHEMRSLLPMADRVGMEFSSVVVPAGSSSTVVLKVLREKRIEIAEILCCWAPELWAELARNGILASSVGAGTVEQGALLGGWSIGHLGTVVRLATRVLRGARAADIPVERPMKYGLAINLRTARTLGLTMPPSVLLRADRVFE